jgi:RNA polymerase sigma-70 factor (ECF subfamily)
VRAVERLDRLRGESALTSWLGGVLVNVWRESRRELRWIADDEPEASLDAEAPMPDAASALDLERALAELPDGARAVVLLHDLEGCTHQEIADRLGIPAGTSKSRLSEARRRLRQRLASGEGGKR